MTPPKLRFITKIYHPNIDQLGTVIYLKFLMELSCYSVSVFINLFCTNLAFHNGDSAYANVSMVLSYPEIIHKFLSK